MSVHSLHPAGCRRAVGAVRAAQAAGSALLSAGLSVWVCAHPAGSELALGQPA